MKRIGVYLVLTLLFSPVFLTVHAQSIEQTRAELLTRLSELLKIVLELQVQLAILQGQTHTPPATLAPTTGLFPISRGVDMFAFDNKLKNIQTRLENSANSASLSIDSAVKIVSELNSDIFITQNAPFVSRVGGTITFYGTGFRSDTKVYWNGTHESNINSTSFGNTLSFTVPTISTGRHKVAVGTPGRISNVVEVVVRDITTPNVVITEVSPTRASYGDTITVSGSGFGKSNKIQTRFGSIDGVSSADGRTLWFSFKPEYLVQSRVGTTTQSFIGIANEYGYSNTNLWIEVIH